MGQRGRKRGRRQRIREDVRKDARVDMTGEGARRYIDIEIRGEDARPSIDNRNDGREPAVSEVEGTPVATSMQKEEIGTNFGNPLGPLHAGRLAVPGAYSGHERPPVRTGIGRAGHHRNAGDTPVPGGERAVLRHSRSGDVISGDAGRVDADAVCGAVGIVSAQNRSLPVLPLIRPLSSVRSRARS